MATQWNDKRPMAPHLQIWRWHPAMAASILHRVCVVIAFLALIKYAVILCCIACKAQLPFKGLLYSPLGALDTLLDVFAWTFMALAIMRHAIWDKAEMMEPTQNNRLSLMMVGVSVMVTGLFAVWAII